VPREKLAAYIARLEFELETARARSSALEDELQAVHASCSWKLSAPVRWLDRGLRNVRTLVQLASVLSREPGRMRDTWGRAAKEWHVDGLHGIKRVLFIVANGAKSEGIPGELLLGFSDRLFEEVLNDSKNWPARPKISVLMPTCDTPPDVLRQAIDSVRSQLYENWELCISDDGSTDPEVRAIIDTYVRSDARIRASYGQQHLGISSATNHALDMAVGDFAVRLDHDDMLEKQALMRIAQSIVFDDPDLVYSDEVIVAADGKEILGFALRPQFSIEYLRSHPYIVHGVAFRTELLRELGGLDASLSISQDYDLILRAVERARKIVHIPEVLYRWRTKPESAGHQQKERVMEHAKQILAAHLARTHTPGAVQDGPAFNFFDVRYPLNPGLKVAIVIPTKNHGALVRQCIDSIERTTSSVDYEIVLVNHDSDDKESLKYFDSLRERHVVLNYSGSFNFSKINNWAVEQISPDYTHYLFCNNDIEAIEEGWLERMLELGQRPGTGVVGAKLLYPGAKVCQHAGVGVGMFGAAEHYGKFMKVHAADGSIEQGYMGAMISNREMSAVTAACMLVRADVFLQVGGYDEQLAVGFGDVDLCLRIRAADYLVVFCAHAQLLHHESLSRGKSAIDPHPEDTALFIKRWADFIGLGDPYFNPALSHASTRWAFDAQKSPRRTVQRRVVSLR
jgi:GT2 family glycosyltransferase